MGLRLIIGPSASGKSGQIAGEIAAMVREDPQRSIIYIVPEQSSLRVEQMLMEKIRTRSLIGPSVSGFKRLAYRIFEEVGTPAVTWLDDVGKCMILQRIAIEHQSELQYFGRSTMQKGFIERLKLMVTEIIQYRLDEDMLRQMAERQPEGSILRAKLTDIALLWHYFNVYMQENEGSSRLMASEMLLDEFASVISRSSLLKTSEIYIDGYTGFTPQQYRIIEELLKVSPRVTVCLTMTEEAFREAENLKDWRDLPRRLYFTAQKTASKLSDLSAQLGTTRDIVVRTPEVENRPAEIRHALQYLCGNRSEVWNGPSGHVFAMAARDTEEEIQQAMHQVLSLVRDEGYSYGDIAFVCTDLAGYAHALKRTAALYQVPVFVDDKADLTLNPYVQWLEAVCSLITGGFSSQAFLSLLKTGLCGPDRDMLDSIENAALKENWIGKDRILEGLVCYAPDLGTQLEELSDRIHEAKEAGEYAKAIRTLAEEQQIREQLGALSEALRNDRELLQCMQYDRIYGQMETMMDQLSRILQGVTLSFEEYTSMLKMGITQCRMGQLPAKLDELTVGDLQRSKVEEVKAIFFLGMQGGNFPMVHSGGSLLTDTERGTLHDLPEIAQGEKESLMEQYYLLQLMMGKASDKIYFFSHRMDADGAEIGDSSLWRRIGKCFRWENCLLQEDHSLTLPLPMLYEDGEDAKITTLLQGVEGAEPYLESADQLKSGREVTDEQTPLPPSLARDLMDPTKRLLSVTQMEKYARCPFSYYLRYGLMLKEREVPKVSNLEDGTVLHELLKEAGEYLDHVLSEEEAAKIAKDLAEKHRADYYVYQTSGRFRYYWNKLQKSAAWSLKLLAEQYALSDFKHEAFEWEFSDRPGAGAPVCVKTKDGQEIRLQGKIDRVDLWSEEEQRYIRIIDYKTGDTEVKMAEMYAGLQLQLPVYMEAAQQGFGAKPAGFFYFHLTAKDVEVKEGKDLWDESMKANKLNGLYVSDPTLMQHLDHTVVPGSIPLVIPGSLTKKGLPHGNSKSSYASPEQMEMLREFIHRKTAHIAEGIMDGEFERAPIQKSSNENPCSYCEFIRSCPYDKGIPGTKSYKLKTMKPDEFWKKIEEEIAEA